METIKTKSKDYGNISVIIKDNSQVSIVSSKGNEIVNGFVLNGCITKVSMERVKDGYEYGIVVFIGSCHLYAKAILSTNYAIYTIISDNNLFVDHYVNCILTADKHGKLSLIGLISDNKGLRPMLAAVFLAKDKSF